jgi:hypothetical protein
MPTDPGEFVMKPQHGTTDQPTSDLSPQYTVKGILVAVLSPQGQHVPETDTIHQRHTQNKNYNSDKLTLRYIISEYLYTANTYFSNRRQYKW